MGYFFVKLCLILYVKIPFRQDLFVSWGIRIYPERIGNFFLNIFKEKIKNINLVIFLYKKHSKSI